MLSLEATRTRLPLRFNCKTLKTHADRIIHLNIENKGAEIPAMERGGKRELDLIWENF